jgi:hypothetical protein
METLVAFFPSLLFFSGAVGMVVSTIMVKDVSGDSLRPIIISGVALFTGGVLYITQMFMIIQEKFSI